MRFSKAERRVSNIHTANSPITVIVQSVSVICDALPSVLLPQVRNRPRTTASSDVLQSVEDCQKDAYHKHYQKEFNHHKSSSDTNPRTIAPAVNAVVSISIAAILFVFVLVVIPTATALAILAVGASDIFVPSERFGHRQHCEEGCHYCYKNPFHDFAPFQNGADQSALRSSTPAS